MIDQAGIMMAQGSLIACERLSGVNDNMSQSHYHNYYEIYFLEEGGRYQRLQDELYILEPGEMMLFSPYIMHFSYGAENVPFKRIVLYFHRDEVDTPELAEALDRSNGIYRPGVKERKMIHRLLDLLLQEQREAGEFHKEYQHMLLNVLLVQLVRLGRSRAPEKQEETSRVNQVIRYVHTHYMDDINLDMLAQMFYVSPYYLCREFKQHTNSTIIHYVNVTRVMNAQRKFMETDKNITEISKETGFSNLTHFNRVFKSVTGMTPSGFRKSHRNQEFYVK